MIHIIKGATCCVLVVFVGNMTQHLMKHLLNKRGACKNQCIKICMQFLHIFPAFNASFS